MANSLGQVRQGQTVLKITQGKYLQYDVVPMRAPFDENGEDSCHTYKDRCNMGLLILTDGRDRVSWSRGRQSTIGRAELSKPVFHYTCGNSGP